MTKPQSSAPSQPSAAAKYPQFDSLSKEWHSTAISEAEQDIDHFIEVLMSHSETICSEKKDEIVTGSHVRDAQKRIKKYQKQKRTWRKAGLVITSVFFGIFVPNFFTEVSQLAASSDSSAGNTYLVILYFVASLVTCGISVWLLQTEE